MTLDQLIMTLQKFRSENPDALVLVPCSNCASDCHTKDDFATITVNVSRYEGMTYTLIGDVINATEVRSRAIEKRV
jgi:hypothetical protein